MNKRVRTLRKKWAKFQTGQCKNMQIADRLGLYYTYTYTYSFARVKQ